MPKKKHTCEINEAACAKVVPYQEVYEDSRDWEGIIVSTVWDVKSYFNDLHC